MDISHLQMLFSPGQQDNDSEASRVDGDGSKPIPSVFGHPELDWPVGFKLRPPLNLREAMNPWFFPKQHVIGGLGLNETDTLPAPWLTSLQLSASMGVLGYPLVKVVHCTSLNRGSRVRWVPLRQLDEGLDLSERLPPVIKHGKHGDNFSVSLHKFISFHI
jgi:hypothetical protein